MSKQQANQAAAAGTATTATSANTINTTTSAATATATGSNETEAYVKFLQFYSNRVEDAGFDAEDDDLETASTTAGHHVVGKPSAIIRAQRIVSKILSSKKQ